MTIFNLARSRSAALALALLPLAACVSFGPKVPAVLLTLTPDTPVAAGTTRTARDGDTVVVAAITVPQELSTLRVPVQSGPTAIAYLKDAQWVDAPSRLFRQLLSDTIAAKTGRAVVDPRQAALAPGIRLAGRLDSFGLDAPSQNVVVIYDAALARTANTPLQTRRFEARVPVTVQDGPNVAAALNRAANQLATEVAAWIG